MKALVYEAYGPPEVLHVRNVERPIPRDDEILINVHAAEATKADCEMRRFNFQVKWFWLPLRVALGLKRPKRQILGGYFAGEVASVGKDVSKFAVGDRIFGAARLRLGAYAEFMSLPASYTLVLKPDNISFAEAAAMPLGGLNALKPGGRYLMANPRFSDMLRAEFTSNFTDKKVIFTFAGKKEGGLLELKRMIDDGKIRPLVDNIYPYEQVAEAHRRVESEQRLEAVVLSPNLGQS